MGFAYATIKSTDVIVPDVYYRLDESSGNAIDRGLGGLNLTENGTVPSATGLVAGARGPFTGSNFFSASSAASFSIASGKGFTIFGWYNVITPGQNPDEEFAQKNFEWRFNLDRANASPSLHKLSWIPGTGAALEFVSSAVSTDGWHFVAAGLGTDNATRKIFFDGSSVSDANGNLPTLFNQDFTMGIGLFGTNPADFLMDEWGITQSFLSDAQLNVLYNNGAGLRLK